MKKIKTLLRLGILLLVIGFALQWAAEPLATVVLRRDENGYASTVDQGRMNGVQFASEKLAWLGLGLIIVASVGWVNQPDSNN